MRKLIDANVILRYLLNDNEAQSEKAAMIIAEGAYTLPEVIAEVVYVLQGVYKVERMQIKDTLTALLDEVSIENEPIIKEALKLYADEKIDYVDGILVARARYLDESVFTFDKKLNSLI